MDTTERESREDGLSLARKYIRLQEIGLYIFLSWPVVMMLLAMCHLNRLIGQISVLIIVAAVFIFIIGYVGKQELRDKEDNQ